MERKKIAPCLVLTLILVFCYYYALWDTALLKPIATIRKGKAKRCGDVLSHSSNLTRATAVLPVYYKVEDFVLKEPTNETVPTGEARCEFLNTPMYEHFPHSMQQFYRCWSFWIYEQQVAKQENRTVQAVLYYSEDNELFQPPPTKHRYCDGILSLLRNAGVDIRPKNNITLVAGAVHAMPNQDGYAMLYSSNHAEMLRQAWYDSMVVGESSRKKKSFQLLEADLFPEKNTSNKDCNIFPKITFLNRKGSRQVVNDQDLIGSIRQELQLEYPHYNHHDLEQYIPDSIYFETATFEQQIESFMTTDILVSPHGAQLTSLAFLRSAPCGTLLEIFHSDYCIPYFLDPWPNRQT